jgi:diadenosine tetraphosphate (Ap4A) HIT family hydrolase
MSGAGVGRECSILLWHVMIDNPTWSLHPQLAQDTVQVGDLPLSRLLLMEDANYPWAILVPRRAGAVELIDLTAEEQAQLTREIAAVSAALRAATGCHKLNVAALGNVVAQLHVHVIARFRHDAAWPRPVWGAAPRQAYAPGDRDLLMEALRQVTA